MSELLTDEQQIEKTVNECSEFISNHCVINGNQNIKLRDYQKEFIRQVCINNFYAEKQ